MVLHPLTDDRRRLVIDRTGEELVAPKSFMLVASFNPGYQNILKKLKPSTRQRFLSIGFDFPDTKIETAVVAEESGLDHDRAAALVRLAGHIRNLSGMDLEEGVSTRLLIYAATLIANGMSVDRALEVAIIAPSVTRQTSVRRCATSLHLSTGDIMMHALDLLEPEETVGNLWHNMATRIGAERPDAEAAVRYNDVRSSIATLFRALGGDSGVEILRHQPSR